MRKQTLLARDPLLTDDCHSLSITSVSQSVSWSLNQSAFTLIFVTTLCQYNRVLSTNTLRPCGVSREPSGTIYGGEARGDTRLYRAGDVTSSNLKAVSVIK